MRQFIFAIATTAMVALGLAATDRAEAAPLRPATVTVNINEPVQYANGRCWRNIGWHGAGWYPCWRPGVVVGGGTWAWHDHYAWHNAWHSAWHDTWHSWHRSWHDHANGHAGNRTVVRHKKVHRGARHAHARAHHRGAHHGGHHGGGHHR